MIDGMDPGQLQQVVQLIENIAKAADRLADKFDKAGAAVKKAKVEVEAVEKAAAKGVEKTKERLEGIEHQVDLMFKSMNWTGQQRWGEFFRFMDRSLEEHDRHWKQFGAEIERTASHARGALGTVGDSMGLSGGRGLLAGLSSLKSSILSEMPMGGLIGLMLMGEKKQADIGAGGARAAQMFASLGQVSRGVTTAMTKEVGALYEQWGIGYDELQALTGGMAEFGATGEDAITKVTKGAQPFGKIFKDDVMGMTLAMDMLTSAPIGTFAKQSAQAAQISGKSFRDAAMDITAMSLAIRDTGVNTQAFMGSMMQATNTLRVQKQDVRDVAEAYLKLQHGFKQAGMTKEQSSAMALTGIGALAQGIGGMPEGMQGFMAERVTGKSGIEGIVSMQEGLGANGKLLGRTAVELARFARESFGPNQAEQKFGLQKVMPGLGIEGARAIVDMAKDMEDGLSYDEALKKHAGELNKLVETRDSKQSAFEAFMRQATMSAARVGVDMFKATIAMAAVLYQSFKYQTAAGGSDEEKDAYAKIMQAGDVMNEGLGDAAYEFSHMGGAASSLFKGTMGDKLLGLFGDAQPRMGPRTPQDQMNDIENEPAVTGAGLTGLGLGTLSKYRRQGQIAAQMAQQAADELDAQNVLVPAPSGPMAPGVTFGFKVTMVRNGVLQNPEASLVSKGAGN